MAVIIAANVPVLRPDAPPFTILCEWNVSGGALKHRVVSLTQQVIRKLPVPERGETTAWDADVRGLCVRVTPAGGKSWNLDYVTQDGRRRRKKLGKCDVLPPAAARELARDALAQVARGIDPFAEAERSRRAGTLRELAGDFLEEERRLRRAPATIRNRSKWLDMAIKDLGSLPIASVSRTDVRQLHTKLTAHGEVTANRVVGTLRALYRFAVQTGRLPEEHVSPVEGVRLHRERARVFAFEPGQWTALGQALDASAARRPQWRHAIEAIRLLAILGRRNSEVRCLRWADVDLEAGTLRDIATKTGKKSFPLPPEALEILRRVRKFPVVSPYVFPSERDPGRPIPEPTFHGVFKAVIALAGLPSSTRIHDLRHGVAGVGTSLGLPTSDVAHVLGHADARSSLRYAAAHDDHQRAVVNRVTAEIARQMRGES